MKITSFLARRGWLVAGVASLLVGCGGSTQEDSTLTLASRVDGRVQPASVDQGVPHVKSRDAVTVPVPSRIRLGALAQEKAAPLGSGVGPRLVGLARDVNATGAATQTLQQFQWKATEAGGQVAAISFSAEGAHGLRLGVVAKLLPGGSMLRVYSQAAPGTVFQISGQEVLQRIQRQMQAGDSGLDGQTWWTPDLGSDEVTLEVELPAGTPASALDLAIPRVSQIFENLSLLAQDEFSTKINESAVCQLDATCYDAYANQRNAVARMIFTSGANTYLCTGTLLNDSISSGTPYFLTANHCISSAAAAESLQTDWFYRTPACNSRTLSTTVARRLGGATLLFASDSFDMSLLKLNEAPPAGAFFAGWDANAQGVGAVVMGLHHPRGDMLKISFGNLRGQTFCTAPSAGTVFQCGGSTGNYHQVGWSRGTTEGGSSGSALFNGANQVIGTLYGGSSSCSATASPEFYGRFDVAYNAALKNWLSPAVSVVPSSGRSAVYRFYNGLTGAHFFTTSAAERDNTIQNAPSFAYEGIAFYAQGGPQPTNIPVYRFYGTVGGAHFYTSSAQERDSVLNNLPAFRYEGVAWYASPNVISGVSPVYRFYRPSKQVHFYTIGLAERDFIIANNPEYVYEGVGYYAWTSQ
ncbi:MAG: trypsin-like peptidase domain-containing protein [Acidovorax sp.]|nr:trypsin-like peptidase domain-containing protein [Acidovorax sp.]